MKRNTWIVTESAARPAGLSDECFYCNVKIGDEHAKGCVIRSRTVVLDVSIRMVTEVPEDWAVEDIDFRFQESSWCASNIVEDLERLAERRHCLCDSVEVAYMREATAQDESDDRLFIGTEESIN